MFVPAVPSFPEVNFPVVNPGENPQTLILGFFKKTKLYILLGLERAKIEPSILLTLKSGALIKFTEQ